MIKQSQRFLQILIPQSIQIQFTTWRLQRKYRLRLSQNYDYDQGRYLKWAVANDGTHKTQANLARMHLRTLIMIDYHRIEKGLSLKSPRPGFGAWFIPRFLDNLQTYQQTFGMDETAQIAYNALLSYDSFNVEHGIDNADVQNLLLELRLALPSDQSKRVQHGGIIWISPKKY
jgi:hypothetical protein